MSTYTGTALANAFNFFDQIFEDTWYPTTIGSGTYQIPTNYKVYDTSYPPMNVWIQEETKDLVLEFAVAGIPQDKIHIDFEGDKMSLDIESYSENRTDYVLTQKGIRSSKSKTYYTVPQSKYDIQNASAELKDGILSVRIPAREDQRPRRLQITSG
jgi:HSP20 family molecular chaperone IbpA